jgi:choline kinase
MQAVILVAGQGSRLRPLTDHRPKCLVELHGRSLMAYQLEALYGAGIRDCVIVVGHLADRVRDEIGTRYRDMAISYVENPFYDRTNNIYSLWLARGAIRDDVLLLEGDLIYDAALLTDLIDAPCDNAAVVDLFQPFMNGTVILTGPDGARSDRADAMVLKRDQGEGFDFGPALKTVNIYKFSYDAMAEVLMPALGECIAQGLTDDYYEGAIAQAVENGNLRLSVVRTGQRQWAEIDTAEDLADARRMRFAPPSGTAEPESDGLARSSWR